MRSVALRLPFVALCAATLPTSVHAQARDTLVDPRRLPMIEVVGSLLPRATPDVGASTGLATRVVTTDPLARMGARLLANLVAGATGASLYDDLGSRFKPTLVMRGFAVGPVVGLPQGVSVFLDGIPVNEVDAGQANLELLPFDEMQQLELFSGVTALLGPNTMGGAVNLVTRQGSEQFEGALTLGGGSFGGFEGHGFASGSAGNWRLFGAAASDEEDGWRQRTTSRVRRALLNVMRGDVQRSLRLQLNAAQSVAQTAGSLPLSVYDVMPDSNLTGGDFEDVSQLHIAVSGNAQAAGGALSGSLWHRANRAERFNVNQINDPDVRSFSETSTTGVLADWRRRFEGTTMSAELRSGVGGSFSNSGIEIFAERIDPGLTTRVRTPISRFDVFTEASATRSRVTLSGGLRYDMVHVPFRNLIDPARDTTSTFHALNPRATLSIALRDNLRAWAGLVRSFRAPAVIEIACADPEEPCPLPFALGDDPPIDPVRATTQELGVSWAYRRVQLDASLYRTNVQDEIFLFPYEDESEPDGSTIDGFFANIPRTRREGVELAALVSLPRAARLSLRVNQTRATFQSSDIELFSIREEAGEENEVEAGDHLPLVPDMTLAAGFTTSPLSPVRVGVDTRYIGKQWLRGDEANDTAPLPGYWVTDLHGSVRVHNWEVRAAVRNVLDARYATFGTFNINQGADDVLERFLTPGQPRSVHVTISRRWGGQRQSTGGR